MCPHTGSCNRAGRPKQWPEPFYQPPRKVEYFNIPQSTVYKNIGARDTEIDILFREYADGKVPWKAGAIRKLFGPLGTGPPSARNPLGGYRKGAWFYKQASPNRSGKGASSFHSGKWLTAPELRDCLQPPTTPTSSSTRIPNKVLRQTFITHLDGDVIVVLAASTSEYQADMVRNAIWTYTDYKSSMSVQISPRGVRAFHLQFSLPHIYKIRITAAESRSQKLTSGFSRKWQDLSFLNVDESEKDGITMFKEGRIVLSVCGVSDHYWDAYGFGEAEDCTFESDDEDDEGEEEEDDEENANGYENYGAEDFENPVWGTGGVITHSGITHDDPRYYFLVALHARSAEKKSKIEEVVYTLKECIIREMIRHSSALSHLSDKSYEQQIREAYEWNRKATTLLRDITTILSRVVKDWKRFSAPNGDIAYFEDTQSMPPQLRALVDTRLDAIVKIFEGWEDLMTELTELTKSCSDAADELKLGLSMELAEATKDNKTTTEFTVFIVSPISLVIAAFSMSHSSVSSKLWAIPLAIFALIIFLLFVHHILRYVRVWGFKAIKRIRDGKLTVTTPPAESPSLVIKSSGNDESNGIHNSWFGANRPYFRMRIGPKQTEAFELDHV